MNIVDIIIILLILMGAVVGFKRGFLPQFISSIGFILVVVLSFLLKNPVSVFLYEHLPFFTFAGFIKGVTVLNIALYEIIAFLILMSIFTFVLNVVIKLSNVIEKLLHLTIILTPISRIGGMIVGLIESYVWVFVLLYVISMPVFNLPFVDESNMKNKILNNTPILSNTLGNSLEVINEFVALKDKYETAPNAKEFNKETLELFLKYKIITPDSVDTLVEQDKLKIDNIDSILKEYRKK